MSVPQIPSSGFVVPIHRAARAPQRQVFVAGVEPYRAMSGIAKISIGDRYLRLPVRNHLRVLRPLRVHVEPLVIRIPLREMLPHILQQ